jgi:hypothetical protein
VEPENTGAGRFFSGAALSCTGIADDSLQSIEHHQPEQRQDPDMPFNGGEPPQGRTVETLLAFRQVGEDVKENVSGGRAPGSGKPDAARRDIEEPELARENANDG